MKHNKQHLIFYTEFEMRFKQIALAIQKSQRHTHKHMNCQALYSVELNKFVKPHHKAIPCSLLQNIPI